MNGVACPPLPCLAGVPAMNMPKIPPLTLHTTTRFSSSETVTRRCPSGDHDRAVTGRMWPSRTYRRVAVRRSNTMAAPSAVPTARRCDLPWKSIEGKLRPRELGGDSGTRRARRGAPWREARGALRGVLVLVVVVLVVQLGVRLGVEEGCRGSSWLMGR